MMTDKEVKKMLKEEASKNPDKFYATSVLKANGFMRKQCVKCGTYFWTTNKGQETCGDSMCSGGFRFFENTPVKEKMDFITVWRRFSELFKSLGYTPINRYPVVARWNPTMDFTIASIAAFQPYVISGEVEPPANPLVIPQFCLRFGDVDNVGVTGSHMTGFIMIGQHMFVSPEQWDQDKVFSDILKWLTDGLGLPLNEITFHEDAWAGGGNAGPCMEYFSRGVELGNQVYMLYEQTPDGKLQDLKLKVLDMGMGMERNAWFSQGTNTIYEATFPTVVKKLLELTGVEYDQELMRKYVPYAGKLNLDEIDDIGKAWEEVSELVGIDVDELKRKIEPLTAIFSIAEHTRSLLFALSDGALPSNVGGGYNLRVLVRRALSFINKFGWEIRLADVCRWHADYLKPLFPELSENLDDVERILDVERKKFEATKLKTQRIVERLLANNDVINEDKLIELYDSDGISPSLVIEEARKLGKEIKMPENFYGKVSARHEHKQQLHATKREEQLNLDDVPETKALYFDDYEFVEFTARVLKVIDNYVVLDKTAFYPTSGGQLHDTGILNNQKVIDVFKQGSTIVHVLEEKPLFKEGDTVEGKVDYDRRKQLTIHHTQTHILNAAARKILGKHVNQAGAKKTPEKAHLDISHYENPTQEQVKEIEDEANRIIKADYPIHLEFMPRRDAEQKYGMSIYQGGAVPGKMIRIVEIPGIDVEACAGTHLHRTGEAGPLKILKTSKIQDAVVRIEFVGGQALEKTGKEQEDVLSEISMILGVPINQIPSRAEELFKVWKKARKAIKKKKILDKSEFEFKSTKEYSGDILGQTATALKTQKEYVLNTIKRFLKELDEFKKKMYSEVDNG